MATKCRIITTYSPQVFPNPNFAGIPSVAPTLTYTPTITFQYPFDAPTLTLEIYAPELSNSVAYHRQRILRYTRGDVIRQFRSSIWPNNRFFNFQVTGLSETDKDAVLTFLRTSLGNYVKYTDYESLVWKVLVMNPNELVTQAGRGCQYVAQFQLQV